MRRLPFSDRVSAGQALGHALQAWRGQDAPLVLALPRGGVPVAVEVAAALAADLDVLIVRKLGVPGQPELAMGAIASGGIRVMNDDIVRALGIPPSAIERVANAEMRELERRSAAYRGQRPPPVYAGRTLILVDDGIATGASIRAAIAALRAQDAARIIVAAPVAPPETMDALSREADAVVCLETPADFGSIGRFYHAFPQLTDDEVRTLLARAWAHPRGGAGPT